MSESATQPVRITENIAGAIVGKTVAGTAIQKDGGDINQFAVRFTDGSYVVLGISSGYEPGDEYLDFEEDPSDAILVGLGFKTEDDVRAEQEARQKATEEARRLYDHREYMRLKAIFESRP